MLRLLQGWNVDVSATTTNNGWNAAHFAATEGRLDILRILRALQEWNDDLSATTNNGWNVAHIAVGKGHLDILRALQEWNVDLSTTDNDGWNIAHIAAEKGRLDILRVLRDWDVDLSATTNNGRNVAHFAAQKGHLHALTELKAWQVDLDARDEYGYTPLNQAVREESSLRTAQHLILLGAQVWPADFPAALIEIRHQLMAWADDHLRWHHAFICAVLTAIHDEGTHTAEGQTNWLARLQGFPALRIHVSEYLEAES